MNAIFREAMNGRENMPAGEIVNFVSSIVTSYKTIKSFKKHDSALHILGLRCHNHHKAGLGRACFLFSLLEETLVVLDTR